MNARADGKPKSNVKNLLGQRFSRLTVVAHSHIKYATHFWVCRCDCGKEKVVRSALLTNGNTRSCGCLQKEWAVNAGAMLNTAHGHSANGGSREWRIWSGMIGRCKYPSHSRWAYYGGRGIRVCDRWKVFENFLQDVGEIANNYTLDRIDNDGNYCPGNCRLATMKDQAANRSGPFCTKSPHSDETIDLRCNQGACD